MYNTFLLRQTVMCVVDEKKCLLMITENMPWWKKRLVEQTGGGNMDKKRKGVKEPNSWFNDFVKKRLTR